MCGWMPNGILAAGPSRVSIRRNATAYIGAPRSLMKTYRPGCLFALETAKGAKFYAGQWVDGRDPIFKSIDVQAAMDKVGLVPAQRA